MQSAQLPQCGHTTLVSCCSYCVALRELWYRQLEKAGFKEIELTLVRNEPLKQWTGSPIDTQLNLSSEALKPLQSSFPQSPLNDKLNFLNHPSFDELCQNVCSHGSHKLNAIQVREIWIGYTEGGSCRNIALQLKVHYVTVFRTIKQLNSWMNLMNLEAEEEVKPAKVVMRLFYPRNDEAFIYASWRNSLWYDDDKRNEGDSDQFFRRATNSIRTILNNPKTQVRIACLEETSNHIIGYSIVTDLCLHFVYVKADYRGYGIGSLLVPKEIESVSPVMTKVGRAIAIKKGFIKKNKENDE